VGLNQISNNINLSFHFLLKKINGSDISETDLLKIKTLLDENALPRLKNVSSQMKVVFESKIIKKIKDLFDDQRIKNFPPSFYKLFNFFKPNVIEDIFSYFIERKMSIRSLIDLIKVTENAVTIHKILDIFIDNIAAYKNEKDFFEFYKGSIVLLPSSGGDSIRHFLFFISLLYFINDENIRSLIKTDALKIIGEFRKNLFDNSRKSTVDIVKSLIENKSDMNKIVSFREKAEEILKFDLWTYTETHAEIISYMNGFFESKYVDPDDKKMFYKLNEISNKAFKNFDLNMSQYIITVQNLSEKIYNPSDDEMNVVKECELIAGGFDIFEKEILKTVLKKINRIKGMSAKKDETTRNRMLHLLIDDDLKIIETRKDRKTESGGDLGPLDDVELVYNPKNEILLYFDDKKYVIRKTVLDDKEIFMLSGYENDSSLSQVNCENEESLKSEMEKIGFDRIDIEKNMNKIRILTGNHAKDEKVSDEEAILDAAVEVVNEIKSGYAKDEIEVKKEDIAVIAGEVLDDRKKIFNDEKSKKIIAAAIDISLKEKDFEDL
jgi:hypothetical protein